MSVNERATSAATKQARERARSKAERERALKAWMEQFVGAVDPGFEFVAEDYIRKSEDA